MEAILIQYPRGSVAVAWLDPVTGLVKTSHPGLSATLRRGMKDWCGRILFPFNGRAFLSATYDHFFLNGYHVRWVHGVAAGSLWQGRCN
jgi:hypothetical protein